MRRTIGRISGLSRCGGVHSVIQLRLTDDSRLLTSYCPCRLLESRLSASAREGDTRQSAPLFAGYDSPGRHDFLGHRCCTPTVPQPPIRAQLDQLHETKLRSLPEQLPTGSNRRRREQLSQGNVCSTIHADVQFVRQADGSQILVGAKVIGLKLGLPDRLKGCLRLICGKTTSVCQRLASLRGRGSGRPLSYRGPRRPLHSARVLTPDGAAYGGQVSDVLMGKAADNHAGIRARSGSAASPALARDLQPFCSRLANHHS